MCNQTAYGYFCLRIFFENILLSRKTIGHLFYATFRCVHHFKAVGEFKLELQSWNDQFGSKSVFLTLCDLKNSSAMLLQAMYIIS